MRGGATLAGTRVVVTRATHQAAQLVEALESRGATAERLPLLEIAPPSDPRPLERAASELALYRWLVVTSTNTVDALLPASGGALPPSLRVAAIGRRTAAALAEYGVAPELVSEESRAEALAEALEPHLGRRERVLLPQAADARPVLAERLEAAGAEVVRVCAYRKRTPAGAEAQARRIFADGPLGWVTFTSPSTVRRLIEVLGDSWSAERLSTLCALSIGPVTSGELRRQGAPLIAQATEPTVEGLIAALERALAARPGTAR